MHIFFRFDCCSLLYLLFYKSRICKKGSGGFLIKETVFFLHTDHIGSSALVTTETGAKYQEIEYRAFGELHSKWQNDVWNLWNESDDFGDIGSYLFTGQQYDSETGLYYYGARYYDPFIGRFISPDSVVDDALDSQGYNRYSYCKNNPVVYGDPSGNRSFKDVLKKVAQVIVNIVCVPKIIFCLTIAAGFSKKIDNNLTDLIKKGVRTINKPFQDKSENTGSGTPTSTTRNPVTPPPPIRLRLLKKLLMRKTKK